MYKYCCTIGTRYKSTDDNTIDVRVFCVTVRSHLEQRPLQLFMPVQTRTEGPVEVSLLKSLAASDSLIRTSMISHPLNLMAKGRVREFR